MATPAAKEMPKRRISESTAVIVPPEVHDQSAELFEAIGDGDLDRLKGLLDSGVPPHVVDEDGATPLHRAAEGETECASTLLETGTCCLEYKTPDGDTALMAAIRYEDAEIVALMVSKGCHVSGACCNLAEELGKEPAIWRALTGEEMGDRPVRERNGSEEFRRVSVSATGGINEFTSNYSQEQTTNRRKSCMDDLNDNAAADAALLVPEKPEDDDEEPLPGM